MAVESYPCFLNAETYPAEQLRRADGVMLARNSAGSIGTVAGGIIPGSAGDLQITPPGSGLSVNVAAGECIVPGSALYASTPGGYYLRNTASLNVTGFTSNASNPTIYAVVATINDAFYHGAVNSGVIQAVSGTPTSGATLTNLSGAPSIPDASLLLGWVLVPASVTNIVSADILNAASFQWNSTIDQFNSGVASYLYTQTPGLGIIRDSSAANKTLKPFQHYIVSTGSPTYTLPAPFPQAVLKVTNYGSGTAVISHNGSEVIYGPGQGASGASSINVAPYGNSRTLESDGTSWFESGASSGAVGFASGSIASPVSLTAGTGVKVFDTASLGVGTWLIVASVLLEGTDSNYGIEVTMVADTAVATLTGQVSGEYWATAAVATGYQTVTLTAIAVVTTAGTIEVKAYNNSAGALAAAAATQGTAAYAGATGYTAVQLF